MSNTAQSAQQLQQELQNELMNELMNLTQTLLNVMREVHDLKKYLLPGGEFKKNITNAGEQIAELAKLNNIDLKNLKEVARIHLESLNNDVENNTLEEHNTFRESSNMEDTEAE